MLGTIKKVFFKENKIIGTLYIQGEKHENITLSSLDTELTITGLKEVIKIPFSNITDLLFENNILSFISSTNKYCFESLSKSDCQILYDRLKPNIKEKCIFKAEEVEYFNYNTETRKFDKNESKVIVKIIHSVKYHLRIEDSKSIIHLEDILTSTQYYMDQNNFSFVWSVYSESQFLTFCLKFINNLDFLEFLSKYVECSYKSVNLDQKENKFFEDMVKINKEYITEPETNVDDKSMEEWANYEEETKLAVNNSFIKNESVNKHLIIGNNKVFVTRGSSLGVFDVENNDVEFKSHIKDALSDPEKIITHNKNQNLLILDKELRDKLQLLDLNRGEVVDKWDLKTNINDYFDGVKFSNEGTLVGVSDSALIRIDPRTKEKVVEKNEYKTKNGFSCGVATQKGDVAVASKKGDLRLYNKINIRAKSLLPGFGDEILGIDSNNAGSLIVCTCKSYILLFKTPSNYSEKMGSDKPTPIRLQLKPQHLHAIDEGISFSPAKFDQDEKMIITSTGRFIIKWQIDDLLAGNVYNYSIKALYDKIVDENFVFNGQDIVVALPNDVKKISEKDLKKPRY